MKNRNIIPIIVPVGFLFLSMFFMVSVLTSGGNVLGSIYKSFLPVFFILGALMPKQSLIFQLILAGSLDVLKKIMVVDGYVYYTDLFFLLGAPPMMLLGICANVLIKALLNPSPKTKAGFKYLITALIVICLTSASAIAKGGISGGTLKLLANTSAYFGLIFCFPILYPTAEGQIRYLKVAVLSMIIPALYGLYHFKFGLFRFEQDYIFKTGLTSVAGAAARGEGIFGPFASQGGLSGMMSIFAVFACLPFLTRTILRNKNIKIRGSVMLAILFFLAAIFSLKRMPVMIFPMAVSMCYILRSRTLLKLSYFGLISGFVALVTFSPYLQENLNKVQVFVSSIANGNEVVGDLLRVQTFNVRLLEFMELRDPENWKPFGVGDEKRDTIHSALVEALVTYGWVPLLLGVIIIIPFLIKFHKVILRRDQTINHVLILLGSSIFLSATLASVLGGGFINTYPVPYFMGLSAAIGISAYYRLIQERKDRARMIREKVILKQENQRIERILRTQ